MYSFYLFIYLFILRIKGGKIKLRIKGDFPGGTVDGNMPARVKAGVIYIFLYLNIYFPVFKNTYTYYLRNLSKYEVYL